MAKFEDQLTALEAVVERLERGELSLEDSVRLFEEGITLSNACKLELERAEGRIQVLVERQGGAMETADLDEEADE
jgi:exodeoxyribonuclease VII small subunit